MEAKVAGLISNSNIKNMKKITAQEARKLAGPTIEERIEDVYDAIKKAAENKKRKLILHDWANDGYGSTESYKALKKELESNGFEVDFHYDNMYVYVEW